jgi:hypothetical protein
MRSKGVRTARAVITPLGTFPNYREAADYYGIHHETATSWAKHQRHGWQYADIESLPDRYCAKTDCGKLLVQREYEYPSRFCARIYCDIECCNNDPEINRKRSETMMQFYVDNPEFRIEQKDRLADLNDPDGKGLSMRRTLAFRKRQSDNLKAQFRTGKRVPRIHRNNNLEITHEGFTG